jgi:hypothetical protein
LLSSSSLRPPPPQKQLPPSLVVLFVPILPMMIYLLKLISSIISNSAKFHRRLIGPRLFYSPTSYIPLYIVRKRILLSDESDTQRE